MAQEISGVYPGSDDYSHEVVLSYRGKKYGLHLLNGVASAHIVPPQRQPPPVKLEQNSWHAGRGAEIWQPNAYNYYDSLNAWTSTPNKLHPTLLMQWYTGFRDAEANMPSNGDMHKWLPLYPGSGSDPNRRYQSVSFTASATSNRERCFLIIRKKGTPGTLTFEICADSTGSPGSASKTVTKTAADLADQYLSVYLEFKPSSVLAVTASTAYHIKLYGAATDNPDNCWEVLCDSAAAGKNSSDNTNWSATTYSPYYRITNEDVNQRIFLFNFDGAWYAVTSREDGGNSQLYIYGCRGRATAGTSTTLTDSGAGQYGGTWTTNMWAGLKIRIVRGAGRGQVRTITSNTATEITVSTAWDTTPTATSQYVIYGGNSWKEITGHGLGWVSARPAYANGTIYFPQDDTVDIRIMHLDYTAANDHGFDAENTKHNRAYYLVPSYDSTLGPAMLRANEAATSGGTPDGRAISYGKGATSPSGSPLVFGTDITFQASRLVGDNTFQITGLYFHQNDEYVAKEDLLYNVSGGGMMGMRYGADFSPDIMNGAAACTGMDGLFYIAANHDVLFISGSNSYPTNLPFNLPSSRGGYVQDLCSVKGWLFAALDARESGYSSIVRMGLSDRSWHEQLRSFAVGRRIRTVAWMSLVDTRPHLAFECQGELMYQVMPLFGVRPLQDSGLAYQHEAEIEFSTMDLLNTDPKFFSYFACNSKNLANASTAAVYGREVAIDYQLNDQVGGSTWTNAGSFGISPQDKVELNKGSQYKIRPRLRIESDQANNPPVVENLGLSLFTRTKRQAALSLDINAVEEDDVSGEEIFDWIIDRIQTADTIDVKSIFSFLDGKRVILPAEPNSNITNLNPETGWSGLFSLYLEFLPT